MTKLFSLARVFGLLLMVFSATYTLPIFTARHYHDGTLSLFVENLCITFALGGSLWVTTRDHSRELKAKDGFLLVLIAWTGIAAISAIPLPGQTQPHQARPRKSDDRNIIPNITRLPLMIPFIAPSMMT